MTNSKNFKYKVLTAAFIALFLSMTSVVQAKQYYKWVDSNGSTHYTTTPPPKNVRTQSKVHTYGWHNDSTSTTTPNSAPSSTTATHSNDHGESNHSSVMLDQPKEANAALQNSQNASHPVPTPALTQPELK